MDPLSTTASIVAILQLSAKLVGYINTTAGATKDRKRLREEVRACSNILQELKDEADDFEEGKAWSHTIKTLEGPNAPLRRLHIALNLIRIKLQPKDGSVKALKWPFQEKGLQKIIETLEREKSLLSLALENNSRKLLQEIIKHSKENDRQLTELVELVKKSVQGNQDSVKELKDQLSSVEVLQTGTQDGINRLHEHQSSREASEERKAILDWLTPINYASQQYGFFNKRQSGTGQWVLESDVYQAWSKAEKQTLLCLGGPGVGKTILTSIMVDDIYERYREDPTVAVAYLYCDFGRQDEQTVDNLTASLLRQLAEGQSPLSKTMKDLYSKHEKKQTRPPLEDISEALQTVAASYSRVFILVDALDECQARTGCQTRFLLEIFGLQEKCNVNLLSTSRFTPEITWMFKGSETLEIRANSKDVRKYLDGRMFQLPDFVGHNRELQEEIKTMIVQSADGMYVATILLRS
jgi:GTPase SAR1 family protein